MKHAAISIVNLTAGNYDLDASNNPDDNRTRRSNTSKDKDSTVEKTSLKVAEADSKDVGRRIARIDPKISQKLGLSSGDVIEISSEKAKASVLNWLAYQQDYGKGLIRLDGYIRNRLDVSINDTVEVRKIEVKDAKSITLAPTEPLRIIGAEEYLASMLEGQLVTKGDIVPWA